ncbi:MAG: UDP-N-acetylmuramoylalanine--D-glutamate ligase [Clostridia bacterium]|nr:UDP-N-acetylmuramoylalanine--D-glutamate ligase [Clostridia bacterium]
MQIKDRKALVIGAAVSGIPTVKKLYEMGAHITLNDKKSSEEIEKMLAKADVQGIRIVGGEHPVELAKQCDFVIVSPGVPLEQPIIEKARELGKEVIGEIELAYRLTKTPIAAITGTNGKTTTTALLGEIMKESGRQTFVTGNIGNAMISEVDNAKQEDIFVLEASSFQLDTIADFKPTVAAILNVTPDHMDRHKTLDNYIAAKCKVFKNQTEEDYSILNMDNEVTATLEDRTKGKVLFFSRKQTLKEGAFVEDNNLVVALNGKKETVINVADIFIPGPHNLENSLAAALMAYCLGVKAQVIGKVLKDFRGVEHRVEYVDEVNGVTYYNDSKGTNTDASIQAVLAMSRPIVLIAGGYDKGGEFDDFIKTFDGRVKEMVLIGKTADKIEQTARRYGFNAIHRADSFEDAFDLCTKLAVPGDCVLLSPACASWGMFNNFEERGRIFKSLVKGLRGIG